MLQWAGPIALIENKVAWGIASPSADGLLGLSHGDCYTLASLLVSGIEIPVRLDKRLVRQQAVDVKSAQIAFQTNVYKHAPVAQLDRATDF